MAAPYCVCSAVSSSEVIEAVEGTSTVSPGGRNVYCSQKQTLQMRVLLQLVCTAYTGMDIMLGILPTVCLQLPRWHIVPKLQFQYGVIKLCLVGSGRKEVNDIRI